MRIEIEAHDREYFEKEVQHKIPDEVWERFTDYINSGLNGTLRDQLVNDLWDEIEKSWE